MKRDIIRLVVWQVIATAVIKGLIIVLGLVEPTFFWIITFFVFGVSVLVFLALIVFGHKKPERFIRLVLSSMVAKLIVFMIFMTGVIYLDVENANTNVVLFLALYICYTSIEVTLVFRKISINN